MKIDQKTYPGFWFFVRRCLLGALILLGLAACQEKQVIRIGFIGELSEGYADLAVESRNGVMLALEQRNAKGGVLGKTLELEIRNPIDDETAKEHVRELIEKNVEVIIGPTVSRTASVILPVIEESRTILVSHNVSSSRFANKYKNFLQLNRGNFLSAEKMAGYLVKGLHYRRVSIVHDLGNDSGWHENFKIAFERNGGKVVDVQAFASKKQSFYDLSAGLLLRKPDVILIYGNALDSALLCQNIRKLSPLQPIAMSPWSATERFVELAGRSAEGVIAVQYINSNDKSDKFIDFSGAYRKRFNMEPGYASLAAYDAASLIIDAYNSKPDSVSLRDAIVAVREFNGVQSVVKINPLGDAARNSYITSAHHGRFMMVQ